MVEVTSLNKRANLEAGTVVDIQIDSSSITLTGFAGDIDFPITVPVGKVLQVEIAMNLLDE